MQLDLRDDVIHHLENKARQAGFPSVESYLMHLVEGDEPNRDDPAMMSYEKWRERYWEFVAQQKSRNAHFDDSRESIYLGP